MMLVRFIDDPAVIERAFPGVDILGSVCAAERGSAGIAGHSMGSWIRSRRPGVRPLNIEAMPKRDNLRDRGGD